MKVDLKKELSPLFNLLLIGGTLVKEILKQPSPSINPVPPPRIKDLYLDKFWALYS